MLNGRETQNNDVNLSMEQDLTPSPPPSLPPPNISYLFRFLTSHYRMFKNKGDS